MISGALIFAASTAVADNHIGIAVGQGDTDSTGTGTSFEISAARDISDNFAIKASFIDFGEMEFNDNLAAGDLDGRAFEVVMVGRYALADKLNLLAIVGVTSWTISIGGAQYASVYQFDGTDFVSGLGLNYAINDRLSVDFKYKDYKFAIGSSEGTSKINRANTSLGVTYSF